MGLSVKWDITYKCNLNCNHCVNGDYLSLENEELTTDEIKMVIDKLSLLNIDDVHILGGEPTFLEDFYEIIEYFFSKKIKVGFNTNGLKLGTSNMEQVLKNKYLKNIVVSIDGPNAEINDRIRGKKVFERSTNNLRKIAEYKRQNELDFILTLNTVLSKDNYKYVLDMIELAIDIGVDEIVFLQYIYSGNATKGVNVSLDFAEELEVVNNIAKIYVEVKNYIRIIPRFTRPLAVDYCQEILRKDFPDIIHACGAGTSLAFINNLGELYPCDRYRSIVKKQIPGEKLKLTCYNFYDIWDQEIFSQPFSFTIGDDIYSKYIPCNNCKHLQNTCFPCPVNGIDKDVFQIGNCMEWMKLIKEGAGKNHD